MDDSQIADLLDQLRTPTPQRAWSTFLEQYSPVLLDVVRLFQQDEDAVGNCYLFICEQLCENGFRRLRRFRPDGPARFTTWLYAVARNLCLDWHRRETGRHRVFASVNRLSALDQSVFLSLFVELQPTDEALLRLTPTFPHLTVEQVRASAERVEHALTPRQRWFLTARRARAAMVTAISVVPDDEMACDAPSGTPDPEVLAGRQQQRQALIAALSKMSRRERLLLRLRFQGDLTLSDIARLMHLQSPQAADRQIKSALDKLRAAIEGRGKPEVASV